MRRLANDRMSEAGVSGSLHSILWQRRLSRASLRQDGYDPSKKFLTTSQKASDSSMHG